MDHHKPVKFFSQKEAKQYFGAYQKLKPYLSRDASRNLKKVLQLSVDNQGIEQLLKPESNPAHIIGSAGLMDQLYSVEKKADGKEYNAYMILKSGLEKLKEKSKVQYWHDAFQPHSTMGGVPVSSYFSNYEKNKQKSPDISMDGGSTGVL